MSRQDASVEQAMGVVANRMLSRFQPVGRLSAFAKKGIRRTLNFRGVM